MARRSKRRVKQRSKAHRSGSKTKRTRKTKAHPKVGYGAKKRRAKKAAQEVTKSGRRLAAHKSVGFDDDAGGRAPHPVDGAVVAHVEIAKGLLARRRCRQREAAGLASVVRRGPRRVSDSSSMA